MKKNLIEFSYRLSLVTLQISLIAYLVFICFDVLTKEFISEYIDLNIFLYFLLILGIAILWLKKKKE